MQNFISTRFRVVIDGVPLIRYLRETFNAHGISHAISPYRIRARAGQMCSLACSLVRSRASVDRRRGKGIKRGLENHSGNTSALSAIRALNLRRRERRRVEKEEKNCLPEVISRVLNTPCSTHNTYPYPPFCDTTLSTFSVGRDSDILQ